MEIVIPVQSTFHLNEVKSETETFHARQGKGYAALAKTRRIARPSSDIAVIVRKTKKIPSGEGNKNVVC